MRLMEYVSDGAQVIPASREFVWCQFDRHLLPTMNQFLNLPSVSIDLLSVDRLHFRFLGHPSQCHLPRGPGFLQRYVGLVDCDSSFGDSGVRYLVLDRLLLVDFFDTVF